MKWPWQKAKPEPRELYVVCEKGKPVTVCADESTVRAQIASKDRRITSIHQVPYVPKAAD